MEQTLFQVKCAIMSEMWHEYANNDDLDTLFYYNNLGFPFAYGYAHGLIELTESAVTIVESTWANTLDFLGLADTGFTKLSDIYSE
jgi:hypothetical protein